MARMFWIDGSAPHDPRIDPWLAAQPEPLRELATLWFARLRASGPAVRETLHDGYPVVCLDRYPFAYVNVFRAHLNVGFFFGAELPDPHGLLEGTGRFMRHVKVRPERSPDPERAAALSALVTLAHADLAARMSKAPGDCQSDG